MLAPDFIVQQSVAAPGSRLLLVTGSPPGTFDVGEIVLRDIALHYGHRNIHCVAIVPTNYTFTQDPRLDGLQVHVEPSVHVHARRWGVGRLGAAGSLLNYLTVFQSEVSRLLQIVLEQARESKPDRILAVLNNPLMMAVAHRATKALDLPMATLVWDPPDYLFRHHQFDRWSRRLLLREFQQSLACSQQVAVVSETMQRDYAAFTKAPIHILRLGLPMDSGTTDPMNAVLDPDEWVIGFAGSMYSTCAWRAFLAALDHAGWRIAGRPVRIKLLAERISLASRQPARIDYLGYRSPEEAQDVLAKCHLNYLPQPFVDELRELVRYAFPTKLTNYLATGRPVFVHSPQEGALSTFFESNPIGARATSLEPGPIIAALEALLGNAKAYEDASRQVRATAHAHFEPAIFRDAVDRVLGADALVLRR